MDDRFDGPLHVGLDDHRKFHGRGRVAGKHIFQAHWRAGRPLAIEYTLTIGCDLAGAGLIFDYGERVARRRHGGKTENFDWNGWPGFLHLSSMFVDHRTDLAARCTCDKNVADP